MNRPVQVRFAPGCFDTFDGSQEELDALVAEIESWADGLDGSFEIVELGSIDNVDPDVAEYYQDLIKQERAARIVH